MTIRTRLLLLCAFSIGAALVSASLGVWGVNDVYSAAETIKTRSSALRNHLEADMMHDALRADVLAALLAESAQERSAVSADLAEHSEHFESAIDANSSLDLPAEVRAALDEVRTPLHDYIDSARSMVALAARDRAGAKERLPDFLEVFTDLEGRMSAVSDAVEAASTECQDDAAATLRLTTTVLGAACVTVFVSLLIGSLVTVRSISSGLSHCVEVLGSLAGGDLTPRLRLARRDEIGALAASTDTLADAMQQIIVEVQASATEVASAATEIAASSEEMAASMVQVSAKAQDATTQAGTAGSVAAQGGQTVAQTVTEMHQIAQAVQAGSQSVNELGKRGQQIGEVIDMINDIADQTNLLALNAAIEAARAGEQGRGFAVVADEVRKLADRTTKATEQVREAIEAIRTETVEAVHRMTLGTQQVTKGVERATAAGQSLQQIVASAQSVADLVDSISAATKEADAAASQSASACTQLSSKSEQLLLLVKRFKTE